jgi:hypothetical protein
MCMGFCTLCSVRYALMNLAGYNPFIVDFEWRPTLRNTWSGSVQSVHSVPTSPIVHVYQLSVLSELPRVQISSNVDSVDN